jgi:hypothetical protein
MYNDSSTDSRPKRMSFYLFNDSTGVGIGSYFQDILVDDEWIFVVGVVNGTHTQIWKSGSLRDSDLYTNMIFPNNTFANLHFGGQIDGDINFFNGSLDELRIYNRSLTSVEIAEINNSGRVANSSLSDVGLVGWYKLDGGGTTAIDSSAMANNGLILGTTWKDDTNGFTKVTYTYCPDEYVNESWQRTILNLVPGFFVLAILIGTAFIIFYVLKKEGIEL